MIWAIHLVETLGYKVQCGLVEPKLGSSMVRAPGIDFGAVAGPGFNSRQ